MKAKIEKYWPFTIALIIALPLSFHRSNISGFDEILQTTLLKSLNISGTLIGFFLTIFTIISTIKTRRMQFIKEAGLFPRVNKYLVSVIVWHLVNISLILFFPVIESIGLPDWADLFSKGFLIFVVAFSWSLSIRFTSIFIKLLKE